MFLQFKGLGFRVSFVRVPFRVSGMVPGSFIGLRLGLMGLLKARIA